MAYRGLASPGKLLTETINGRWKVNTLVKQQPTLAEAFIDAWQLVMSDSEIPDEIKARIACAFVGVPEMALQQRGHFIGTWPHPVAKVTRK